EEQKERHEGGNKWIGTGGTSPFGHGGYNPQGIRIGGAGKNKSAVKVWDQRAYKDYDDTQELGTRNIKVALRRLRKFAREGAPDVLDIDDTIRSTARNAGYLDIKMVPERHNAVKVLLFLDVGGSMDPHVRVCEELFSAAKSEFKHLEYFYFHNFVYESVWKDNNRRHSEKIPLFDVLHKYTPDYKIIFVGDATMSAYEILNAGGSIEHWNEEAGAVWMKRLLDVYPRCIWLNPEEEQRWDYTPSIQVARELLGADRMFPMTLAGLDRGMRRLSH
ncbi:MAG: vWA domain-containing protein, partial [Stenotrophobium sp.]